MTHSYNLRTNIKLTERASAMPQHKPYIWDAYTIKWYGLGNDLDEVFRNMRLSRKMMLRRRGVMSTLYASEQHPLVLQGYTACVIGGEKYWARKDNNRTLACFHRYQTDYNDHSQTEVTDDDFHGYFDLVVKKWDWEE